MGDIHVHTGNHARDTLADAEVMRGWRSLYDACPWATSGQSPDFARTWYRVHDEVEPVLVMERDAERVTGLLALARDGDELFHVGNDDVEYHVWLASPENAGDFLPRALAAMDATLGPQRLVLQYLPPNLPRTWVDDPRVTPRCELETSHRRILRLSSDEQVNECLRRRHRHRGMLNKLKRGGDVFFRRVIDEGEILRVLEQFEPMLELRRAASYGVLPFYDSPLRHRLLCAEAAVSGLLHVTVLERGDQILAAHVTTAGKRELSIGGIAHSEYAARFSPGTLLLMELIPALREEGYEILDFTPGDDDYKARFAPELQEVHILKVHKTPSALGAERAKRFVKNVARGALQVLPSSARDGLRSMHRRLRTGYAEPATTAASSLRWFRLRPTKATSLSSGWRRDDPKDLMRFAGERSSYLAVLRAAANNIRAGARMLTWAPELDLRGVCFVSPASAHAETAMLPDWARVLSGLELFPIDDALEPQLVGLIQELTAELEAPLYAIAENAETAAFFARIGAQEIRPPRPDPKTVLPAHEAV